MRGVVGCYTVVGVVLSLLPVAVSSQVQAYSYCSTPVPPTFYEAKPLKPSVPFCVNEYTHESTCDEYTLQNYNQEVDDYNLRLRSYHDAANTYINQLNSYVEQAVAYAKCEAGGL
jgi:hypothetical protein